MFIKNLAIFYFGYCCAVATVILLQDRKEVYYGK